MKLPRDVSGDELAHRLRVLGYEFVRQKGSHVWVTCHQPGTHHLVIPRHRSLRVGTLSEMMSDVASFHGLTEQQLLHLLFDKKPRVSG